MGSNFDQSLQELLPTWVEEEKTHKSTPEKLGKQQALPLQELRVGTTQARFGRACWTIRSHLCLAYCFPCDLCQTCAFTNSTLPFQTRFIFSHPNQTSYKICWNTSLLRWHLRPLPISWWRNKQQYSDDPPKALSLTVQWHQSHNLGICCIFQEAQSRFSSMSWKTHPFVG